MIVMRTLRHIYWTDARKKLTLHKETKLISEVIEGKPRLRREACGGR